MFGEAIAMAMILGVKASERIPPNLYIHARTIHKRSNRVCLKI
jgi:hypothetical protein